MQRQTLSKSGEGTDRRKDTMAAVIGEVNTGSLMKSKESDTNGSHQLASEKDAKDTKKLTLHIAKPVIKEAKLHALKKDMTVSALTEKALIQYLEDTSD